MFCYIVYARREKNLSKVELRVRRTNVIYGTERKTQKICSFTRNKDVK